MAQRREIIDVIRDVYEAMESQGYEPLGQLIRYAITKDPLYVTRYNNARNLLEEQDEQVLLDGISNYMDYVNQLAFRDALTGVKNRAAYLEKKEKLTREIAGERAAFAVLVADVNDLKLLNDTMGHDMGDLLLQDAAKLMGEVMESRCIYRIGGDEFVAILEPGCDMEEKMQQLQKRMDSFNELEHPYGRTLDVAMAFSHFRPGDSFEAVFKQADARMYVRKKWMKAKLQE